MNKQSKDGNISWADWSWNPIRGICPVDCKLPDGRSYCYARAMYKRFKMNEDLRLNLVERLAPRGIKKPAKIFVCSTIEIFHPRISKKWRDMIFSIIEQCPQHTFQILTKMPENIDRPMPDNVWLGVTVESDNETIRIYELIDKTKAKIKFVSFEPLLGEMWANEMSHISLLDWIIVGRLTGYGKDTDPGKICIEEIIEAAKGKPIFLKNNLKEIWGERLIQEWPRE